MLSLLCVLFDETEHASPPSRQSISISRETAATNSRRVRSALETDPLLSTLLLPSKCSFDAVRCLVDFMQCAETYTSPTTPIESKNPIDVFGVTWYAEFISTLTVDLMFDTLVAADWFGCDDACDALSSACAMLLSDLGRKQVTDLLRVDMDDEDKHDTDNDRKSRFASADYECLFDMMQFRRNSASS